MKFTSTPAENSERSSPEMCITEDKQENNAKLLGYFINFPTARTQYVSSAKFVCFAISKSHELNTSLEETILKHLSVYHQGQTAQK